MRDGSCPGTPAVRVVHSHLLPMHSMLVDHAGRHTHASVGWFNGGRHTLVTIHATHLLQNMAICLYPSLVPVTFLHSGLSKLANAITGTTVILRSTPSAPGTCRCVWLCTVDAARHGKQCRSA